MSEWTPERVRERLGELGISPDATDDQLGEVIDEVITDSQTGPETNDRSTDEEASHIVGTTGPLPELPPELVGKPCRCLDPDCTIPYGLCHCGCGERTKPYTSTDRRASRVKGQYALSLQRHTLKRNGGGVAMPFLAEARRKNGHNRPKVRANPAPNRSSAQSRRYIVTEDEHLQRLARMYDSFAAHADPATGLVQLAAWDALLEAGSRHFGNRASRYGASLLFKDLVHMGCLKSRGPQQKQIIKHPREVDARAAAPAEKAKAEPKKDAKGTKVETHEQMIDAVSPQEMANAIASAMWTRYEWALSELGRLTGIVSALTSENTRLQALLGETQVDASEAARRILVDAAH